MPEPLKEIIVISHHWYAVIIKSKRLSPCLIKLDYAALTLHRGEKFDH